MKMMAYRDSLKSILDSVEKLDSEVAKLKAENARIFNSCLTMRNKQTRNSMLMRKMDNERRIDELLTLSKSTRKRHLSDLTQLERMRNDVDSLQNEYNSAIREFKESAEVTDEDISNLMIGIYNRFQNEILEKTR